jgi:hypothetical protein
MHSLFRIPTQVYSSLSCRCPHTNQQRAQVCGSTFELCPECDIANRQPCPKRDISCASLIQFLVIRALFRARYSALGCLVCFCCIDFGFGRLGNEQSTLSSFSHRDASRKRGGCTSTPSPISAPLHLLHRLGNGPSNTQPSNEGTRQVTLLPVVSISASSSPATNDAISFSPH